MRRRIGFLFICSAAIPIAIFASAAWACGALTTLKASPSVAAPGSNVGVSFRNFGSAGSGWGPVQLRWGSRTGPVLKELAAPSGTGPFSSSDTVQIPASEGAGWGLVVATQSRVSDGTPKSGSPARTT
ncbi:MAG: hypothetical protein ABR549_04215, partial [Mycobacteriales bacterium]